MINRLKIKNFRLLENVDLIFNKKNIIFIGKNAVGKSSIIEAIYYLGITKTYRNEDVITFNKDFSIIEIDNKFKIIISKKGKKVFYNNKEIKKLSDYIGIFKVIMFTIDDLIIIKGKPANRRKFLDIELTQISKEYLIALKEYKKLLKERNIILKNNLDNNYLNILDEKIKKLIDIIIKYRSSFINDLSKYSNEIYNKIIEKSNLKLIYLPNIINSNYFYNEMDNVVKSTNNGPHKDDFRIELNNLDASYLSQGEQKCVIISIKLAIYKIINEMLNEKPIILLDDLLSDLDFDRQNKVIDIIKNENIFITTTSIENINKDLLENSQIFLIEDKIKEWKLNGRK